MCAFIMWRQCTTFGDPITLELWSRDAPLKRTFPISQKVTFSERLFTGRLFSRLIRCIPLKSKIYPFLKSLVFSSLRNILKQTTETLKGQRLISFYLWDLRAIDDPKLWEDWNIIISKYLFNLNYRAMAWNKQKLRGNANHII